MTRTYEHRNAEGMFEIMRVSESLPIRDIHDISRDRRRWAAFIDDVELIRRDSAEAVLIALVANDLDAWPPERPSLDTSRCRLPRSLAEWRWV